MLQAKKSHHAHAITDQVIQPEAAPLRVCLQAIFASYAAWIVLAAISLTSRASAGA
jgi:hypothetical protein